MYFKAFEGTIRHRSVFNFKSCLIKKCQNIICPWSWLSLQKGLRWRLLLRARTQPSVWARARHVVFWHMLEAKDNMWSITQPVLQRLKYCEHKLSFKSWIRRVPRDRCYDFKNIFAEKFGENIGVFCSNCEIVIIQPYVKSALYFVTYVCMCTYIHTYIHTYILFLFKKIWPRKSRNNSIKKIMIQVTYEMYWVALTIS
jgi:hypothetical protein